MIRQIIEIDEDKCTGCGLCIPNCHEGALQMIDDKARLISDLLCDGLGACLGHCPEGAIEIVEREAQPYNELVTIKEIVKKGKNTTVAHLKHLKEHNETVYLNEGLQFLKNNRSACNFDVDQAITEIIGTVSPKPTPQMIPQTPHPHGGGGCPGSQSRSFENLQPQAASNQLLSGESQLTHWPIQMHLLNPMASHFIGCDMLLAADCASFTIASFHQTILKGKKLAIGCPKLDSNKEVYVEKLRVLIDQAKVNTLTVVIMEVPCCFGLLQLAQAAAAKATRKVPIKAMTIGIQGEILDEEWV
jgi:Pyruvate/2-oxoacid:ferredoxin oxidoreductase delta subunit